MAEHINTIISLIKLFLNMTGTFSIPAINMSVDHCGPYLTVITVIFVVGFLVFPFQVKRSSDRVHYKQLISLFNIHASVHRSMIQ